MEKKRMILVCAIMRDGDKYLCTQRLRKGPSYTSEHWEFPGGKVEDNENDYEALRREIREEMDWDIFVGRRLGTIKHEYPDFIINLTAYECMARNNNFKLLAHLDSKWLTTEEFSSLEWTEADKKLIDMLWRL